MDLRANLDVVEEKLRVSRQFLEQKEVLEEKLRNLQEALRSERKAYERKIQCVVKELYGIRV